MHKYPCQDWLIRFNHSVVRLSAPEDEILFSSRIWSLRGMSDCLIWLIRRYWIITSNFMLISLAFSSLVELGLRTAVKKGVWFVFRGVFYSWCITVYHNVYNYTETYWTTSLEHISRWSPGPDGFLSLETMSINSRLVFLTQCCQTGTCHRHGQLFRLVNDTATEDNPRDSEFTYPNVLAQK